MTRSAVCSPERGQRLAPVGDGLHLEIHAQQASRRTGACPRCRRPAARARLRSSGRAAGAQRRPRAGQPLKRFLDEGGTREPGTSIAGTTANDAIGRKVSRSSLQRHGERRALAGLALGDDRSAMQAEPAPARAPGRCPMPSWSRARTPSTRWNRSNSRGSSSAARRPPSRAPTTRHGRRVPQPDRHAALERELQRVREQIEQHFLEQVAVHEHGLRQRVAFDDQFESGAFEGGSEHADDIGGEWPSSVGTKFASTRPASMRAKSSSAFTSFSSRTRIAIAGVELGSGERARVGC